MKETRKKRRRPSTPLGTPEHQKEAILDWLKDKSFNCLFMVTPTFHQELGPWKTKLTVKKLEKEVALFLNRLNRAVMGNAARRHGRKIYTFNAIERIKSDGDGTDNLHCHLLIDCPRPELVNEYPQLLQDIWRSGHWAHHDIDIQRCFDRHGASKYVTKIRTKPNYLDSFDWGNTHLPGAAGEMIAGLLSNASFQTDQFRS